MRVATLGHAGLYVETADQRILVDPVFAETLAEGVLRYCPARTVDLEKMPAPTVLVQDCGLAQAPPAPGPGPAPTPTPARARRRPR